MGILTFLLKTKSRHNQYTVNHLILWHSKVPEECLGFAELEFP